MNAKKEAGNHGYGQPADGVIKNYNTNHERCQDAVPRKYISQKAKGFQCFEAGANILDCLDRTTIANARRLASTFNKRGMLIVHDVQGGDHFLVTEKVVKKHVALVAAHVHPCIAKYLKQRINTLDGLTLLFSITAGLQRRKGE